MGRGAASGGGGAATDILGGLRLLGGVAGVPPELRSQAEVSLHASKREVDFWVDYCGAKVAPGNVALLEAGGGLSKLVKVR